MVISTDDFYVEIIYKFSYYIQNNPSSVTKRQKLCH